VGGDEVIFLKTGFISEAEFFDEKLGIFKSVGDEEGRKGDEEIFLGTGFISEAEFFDEELGVFEAELFDGE
jgi:hypothetical protein